jgi:hypothetical protein
LGFGCHCFFLFGGKNGSSMLFSIYTKQFTHSFFAGLDAARRLLEFCLQCRTGAEFEAFGEITHRVLGGL